MPLTLPGDAEPFLRSDDDFSQLREPAAYCLVLNKPDDLATAWDESFDTRPDFFPMLEEAETVLYVGGTGDLLGRLEDHRDGDVRQTALTTVCEIESLRNIWWCDGDDPMLVERQCADMLKEELPLEYYVHQR